MPFNPLRNEIDKIHLARTGKTSEQIHSDLIRNAQEIDDNIIRFLPFLSPNDPANTIDVTQDIRYNGQIESDISSILTGDSSLKKTEESYEAMSFWEKANEFMMQDSDMALPMVDLDKKTKNNINAAALILKNTLIEGTAEESQKALEELRDKYNKLANSSFSYADKESLRKSYSDMVEQVNGINRFKQATKHFDAHLSENTLEDREKFLSTFDATNQRLSFALKSKQTKNVDIINQLADLESNRVGSILYNPEDLAVYKSSYFSTDQDLNAGMEMQYNYAIKNVADDKIYDYEKQISDIDDKIKDTYNQDQKNQLAIQKNSLNQELSYVKKLSEKLKPLTVEDTYLQSFYPEEYSRKKAKQKQEVFKNERLAEGDQGSWAETLGRNWDNYTSNVAMQLSGIHSLLGDHSGAYRLKSKADYIAPPTFFVGKDLNKNNKIDDSEITRDIHDNRVTFSQVSWTDKKGNTTWNFWSPAEQILPISMDVLNTVFLSKGIGMAARATKVLSWSNLAGAAGLTEANTATFLRSVAPRISTMGNVAATTFPRFYAEERSNFKDGTTAFKVAGLRAIVEGLTESITPDVKLFDGGVAYGALDDIFAKLGKLDPTSISRLTRRRDLLMGLLPKNSLSGFNAALLMAPTATRRLLSGASQEAFEEVASLVGNYFVDKYSSQQNFEVEETNKLNWGSALDTFVEGFIPSLFISGATNLTSRNAIRRERLSQARWNIANNPEQYKQLVANEVSNQKITKEEGLKKTAAIDNIARRLDSMTEINHIKSLTNLLDDKELQFAHFNNRLFQEDLLNVDTTELSPEQLQEYEDLLANTSKSILTTSKLADKYVGLDETDKKAIISKLFETQANAATSADTNLSTLLGIAEQTRQSLLSVPVNDARYAFVSEEYKKFQDKIDVSIQERLGRFSQTLENNPENLTNLELQLAADTFYPAIDRMNAIDAQYTLENSPLIQPTEPGPNAPELIQNILDELSIRQTLNESDFQTEIPRNLQNPETKALQEKLLAIAELSPEELQSGELEEGVHDHLTPSQKFELAQQLELHKIIKEESPATLTFLEEQKNQIIYNNYGKSVAGLDVTNTRAKIIEMNKAAMEARLTAPVVNNFAPPSSTPASVSTPVPTPVPVENIPGVTPDIDQVIFNQYSQVLSDLNEIASNQDTDPEENKIQISELIKFALRNLDNLTSLNQVRSALLGLFPDNASEIESALEKANNGVADASGFTFLIGKRKAFVEGVIAKLVSQGQLTVDITVADPFIDVAPETPTDEDIISADNFDSAQDTQNQEVKDVEYTGKGLRLNMVSLSKEDIAIDDFPVTLSYNILDAYSADTRRGKATDLNVRIQSMMGIYEFALSPEAVEGLKELQSKTSLTNEEKDLLVGYFTVNGQLIHDAGFIDYVKEKPSAIGTGVGTTFVDAKGNLLKFTNVGKPSINKKNFLSVGVLAKNKKDVELTQVRTLAENGQVITSPVVGIASGVSIVLPLSNTVNEKIYVHTKVNTLEEVGVGKSYFVRPGSVQLVNENARNKYTGIIIPTNGNSIQALVNAFNEGTLPNELDEAIRTNATEFLNYISRQINSTYIKVDPSKSKLAIRYFKKANLYLSSTNDNKIVVKSKPNKNLQKTQNQDADLLKLGESSYKLVDARLLEENKPFTALVVTGETVSAKQFNTYTDYVKSPEFGATIKREENRKLVFSTDYKVTEPEVDVANDNVEVIDVVENIPAQTSDAKADEEYLGTPEISKIEIGTINNIIINGDLYQFKTKDGLISGVMLSSTEFRIDGISANEVGKGQGSKMFESLISYLKSKGVTTLKTESAGEGAIKMHNKAVDKGLLIKVKEDGRFAIFTINTKSTQSTTDAKADNIKNRKRKDLFPDKSEFAQVVGNSEAELENEIKKARYIDKNETKAKELEAELERRQSKISSYKEVNGIGIAEYTNPKNGLVDVIMTGTSDNDYVGYVRIYTNSIVDSKVVIIPTERWTSKMENKSQNKANIKTMLGEVQKLLPAGHEYTEKTNISLDGLKTYAQQLKYGYEVLLDKAGNPVVNQIILNKASVSALQNAKSDKEINDLYKSYENLTRAEYNEIKAKINALMPEARVLPFNETNGTISINLPVLKSTAQTTEASIGQSTATTAPSVDISKEVILSGLRGGFKAVSYSSFDIRSDENVINQIERNKSFSTTIERKGKKYVLVGLRIIQDVGARTSGRDGYSFAMIEDNGSLPSNIVDLLKEQAINNVSNIYPNIEAVESSFEPIKVPTQATEPTVETPKPLRGRDRLNNMNTGEAPEFFRSRVLSNKINAKQRLAAKNWVANHPIFKNTPFIFDNTINHPEAYASWSKAGIFLFEGANYAEAYHESWHEFSQFYLTPEQKESLYAQAKVIYGQLSFVELEERLAEDFRAYALSNGKTLPENIKKNKDAKSIFTKIWNFLTNLFTDKKTVDHYFSKLYKGNISQFKRNEANAYFKTLYSGKFTYYDQDGKPNSLSFKDSKALLDDVDSLYAFIANNVFKKQGQSFVNIITTPINANSVYPYIKQYLATQYDELLDEYNKNNDANLVPQINVIVDMHDRFASVAQYHKQNSSLFDDKIRKELVNTQIEEIEKTNPEFATYEASVNDFSQKQLASQVLINALKTLSKYENGVEVLHPILGIPLVGNFSTNWNILQRKLSGSNSYADLYSRVEELTETYPQFKQFLEYLPPSDTPIKLMSTMNFKNEFNRIFSMPYIEGYTTEIKRNEEGQISDVRVFQAQSLDTQNIRSSYDTQFALNLSPYSLVNTELGTFYLNTDKYFTNFPGVPPVPKDEEDYKEHNQALYNMLKPLGFNLSENSVEMFVNENPSVQNERVTLIYNKLKSLTKTQKYIITPLASLSSEHTTEVDGKKQKIGGETTSVSSIIQYEVDANPQYVNDMRYNAANKQIWSVNQHTFMTKVISVLNDNKLYPTLDDVYMEMPHLNFKNNPNVQGSFILEYLFKANGERYESIDLGEKTFRQVSLANLLGIKDRSEGEKTIDTGEAQKHFADIMGLVKSGIEEINRLSGKSTTRGLVLNSQLRNFLGFTAASNQADPFNVSGNTEVPEDLFEKRILPLINAEVAVTVKGSANFTINSLDEDGSPKLAYFHKIFTPKQRQSLFSAYKIADNSKSLKDVFKSIPQSKEIFNTFQAYIAKQVRYSEKVLGDEYPVSNTDLFKYHFFSFVSRIEQHKVFFGHPYYYKNAKDIEKRLSMWNAYGSYPVLDAQNLDFLNSSQSGLTMQSQREAYQAYANKEGIKVNPNRANIDQISYIVLADEPVNSATAKASKYYGKNKEAYTNNKKAATQDSAAFCTLDFYRKFYSTSTGITFEMNQEFKRQDNIYKKYLELQTAEEYQVATITKELEAELNKGPFYKFTIKKLQYAGHNVIETGESVPVGHKYTVKPILPSELMGSSELAAILGKLHASSADYAVHSSGSKLSETIKPVKLFNSKGEVNGKAVNTGVIDLKNLKEQVLFENKEDFNTIFSTQFRKLIYKDVRTEEGQELYNTYKGIIESLTGFDKLKFLEQLDNKEKLVEMLIREMSKKNVSETTKDLIKLKEDGTLMHSLDSMIDRTIMESAIVSSVKSAIIRQKVPGAQRIQYPVSLLRPGRKLKYYDIVDGKITKAETIVSFSKGYYPLLNLVSPVDKQPIGELDAQGNPINPYTALTRLNEALNSPKFRATYANQLTIVAIRVPGQAHNSMENFELVEFLPEESGEIILVADEMVVKSGSDFDGDKLFCYDPTIKRNGTFSALLKTPKESIAIKNKLLDKLKENKELFREILDEKKALTQELGDILTKKGFDPTSKVADLYKELQSYKHADENELAASGVITEADLLKLKERLEKGISEEENPDAKRIKTRISKLRSALGEIYDADLSNELGEINKELKELSDKTNETKDQLVTLRGDYSNALLLNISQRLSQPEIFNDLITPNDIRSINNAVSKFGKQVDVSTASLTNIVSPLYQLYVFSLNTYIAALGIDAKNNVFHSLLQKTTFYREDKEGTRNYLLDANRTPEGYINFSELDNVDGQSISYIPSELISAHVDIGKNDGIAQINLNDVATPIVNYVTMAGSRFEDIVQLINMTPAIISYTKGKDLTVILDKIADETPVGNITLDLLKKSKDKYGNYSRYYLKDVVFKNLFEKLTRSTASTMLLTEQGPLGELRRFVQFLELEDQSRDLANVSRATDYDTFSPQNFESFRSRIIDLVPYLKETGDKSKIFNKKGLEDIISNTVISSFEVQQEVLDKFIEVFPVSANSALTNKILIEFAKLKENNKKLDYDKFSRTFKNDLLYTLFINNVPEAQNFETYVDKTNPGNISAMSINLKSRLKSRGIEADNIMFDIMTVTSDVKLKLTPQILSKYLRVGVLDTDLDYSIDMYKEAFEQGFNWSNPALDPSNEADADLIGDMQGFFKAFAYAGIIGSQLNKKFDSFLPLIPESIYTLPMTDVLNKFSSEFDSMIETYGKSGFLTDFVKRFQENHPEFRRGATQPVALTYYKDYVLSRPNSVDMNETNVNELTLTTQPSTSVEPPQARVAETGKILMESFAKLRELNNTLSKNC